MTYDSIWLTYDLWLMTLSDITTWPRPCHKSRTKWYLWWAVGWLGRCFQTVLVVSVRDGGLVYGDVSLYFLPSLLAAVTSTPSIAPSWRNLEEENYFPMLMQDIRLISEGKRQQTYEININHWSPGNIMLPHQLISWHIMRPGLAVSFHLENKTTRRFCSDKLFCSCSDQTAVSWDREHWLSKCVLMRIAA